MNDRARHLLEKAGLLNHLYLVELICCKHKVDEAMVRDSQTARERCYAWIKEGRSIEGHEREARWRMV